MIAPDTPMSDEELAALWNTLQKELPAGARQELRAPEVHAALYQRMKFRGGLEYKGKRWHRLDVVALAAKKAAEDEGAPAGVNGALPGARKERPVYSMPRPIVRPGGDDYKDIQSRRGQHLVPYRITTSLA